MSEWKTRITKVQVVKPRADAGEACLVLVYPPGADMGKKFPLSRSEIVLGRGHKPRFFDVENRGRQHGSARIIEHSRHHVVIEAEAAAPGVLVLADTYFPGWTATVDGVPAPIAPVNLAQRGVPLSPGRHHVVFDYHDSALRYGKLLSLCGLLGVLALLFLRRPKPSA